MPPGFSLVKTKAIFENFFLFTVRITYYPPTFELNIIILHDKKYLNKLKIYAKNQKYIKK